MAKIGLEIHMQLATKSKMFCSCPTEAEKPNTACCEICLGMPGSKPKFNIEVLNAALKLALALNCEINKRIFFSRKNYFYPDLAKNYQISQYEVPVAENGYIMLSNGKKIRIRRLHIEEDPASLIHPSGIQESSYVLIDYNRSGIPLVEIVTEPDLTNAEEAREFLKKLRTIASYLKIFDENKGIIKADANISIEEAGFTRIEVKNITGFKEIANAINYEIERQRKLIAEGGKITQETRGWDSSKQITYQLREKETEEDYGYIFDPDLPVFDIDESLIIEIRKKLPELAEEKEKKFIEQYKIPSDDAIVLASELELAELFERLAAKIDARLAANWLRKELLRVLNYNKMTLKDIAMDEKHLAELLEMVQNKEITDTVAKKILEKLVVEDFSPREYVKKEGLLIVSEAGEIEKFCKEVIQENEKAVKDYLAGEEKALNFLIGKVMAKTRGKANPQVVKETLLKLLK